MPVDGVVTKGIAYLNEAMLTGESNIIEKYIGEEVIGGTVNMGEPFYCQAKKVGADTVLANISLILSKTLDEIKKIINMTIWKLILCKIMILL
ncbi:MAG: hypothetical protein EHV01_003470 [Spiroplasma sp. hy2]|uniref:P-type ATPase n=1 Tax=Spiroplasma sp. hy2 TaxID=2490850 RepID=UPI003B47C70B